MSRFFSQVNKKKKCFDCYTVLSPVLSFADWFTCICSFGPVLCLGFSGVIILGFTQIISALKWFSRNNHFSRRRPLSIISSPLKFINIILKSSFIYYWRFFLKKIYILSVLHIIGSYSSLYDWVLQMKFLADKNLSLYD